MKKQVLLSIFCSLSFLVKAQTKPFILKGQLFDCPEKTLNIIFKSNNGEPLIDTIYLDANGKFYLKTFKVRYPQNASIQRNNIQINNLFVAPGYNLSIVANGKDFISIQRTKKITGIGAQSNRYQFILDSIMLARPATKSPYELSESDLLLFVKSRKSLEDSVAHFVFDKKPRVDKYLRYFGAMVRLNTGFSELYTLLVHANYSIYNSKTSVSFVRNNFDTGILNNIFRDEYLMSDQYASLISGEYLKYLVNIDYQSDSSLRQQRFYSLTKVNAVYNGKIKSYVLNKLFLSMIRASESYSDLTQVKEQFAVYFSSFLNPFYKKSIANRISEKEKDLIRTQIGKPAPKFVLENNLSRSFSLDDFKGRVVYLDLWASWCHPCRAETPFLKTLNEKYKNDRRIAFISIAVGDGINEWKKALEEDKPDWLQLLDKDKIVDTSYFADLIPKFILIDKRGNIVNFDAPSPSSGKEIEHLISIEILK